MIYTFTRNFNCDVIAFHCLAFVSNVEKRAPDAKENADKLHKYTQTKKHTHSPAHATVRT